MTTAAVTNSLPPRRAGMASATLDTGREVGSVGGVGLLGALLSSGLHLSFDPRPAGLSRSEPV